MISEVAIPFDCSGITYSYITQDPNVVPNFISASNRVPKRTDNKPKQSCSYKPKKIIYNGKATIVFWIDGTKTIVKKSEGEVYNKYNAFCAALAKKIFGNNSIVNRVVNSGIEQK